MGFSQMSAIQLADTYWFLTTSLGQCEKLWFEVAQGIFISKMTCLVEEMVNLHEIIKQQATRWDELLFTQCLL